jgi:hypothetical protein
LTQQREQVPSTAEVGTIWEAAQTFLAESLVIDKVMVLGSCRSSPRQDYPSSWFARG